MRVSNLAVAVLAGQLEPPLKVLSGRGGVASPGEGAGQPDMRFRGHKEDVVLLVKATRELQMLEGEVVSADRVRQLPEVHPRVSVPQSVGVDDLFRPGLEQLVQVFRRLDRSGMSGRVGIEHQGRHPDGIVWHVLKAIPGGIDDDRPGLVQPPDYNIVSDAKAALELFVEAAAEWHAQDRLADRTEWVEECRDRKRKLQRRTDFDDVPIKPHRVYAEMNRAFGPDVR